MDDMDHKPDILSYAAVDSGAMGDIKAVAPKPSASKKKAAGTKPRKSAVSDEHPKYSVMIAYAISQLKERRGSSRQAILKYVASHYRVGTEANKINARVKTSLKAGVKSGLLNQTKGIGASGSFRLGQRQKSSLKTVRPRPSTATAKKATGSGKTAAKKSKTGKPKSPAKKTTPKKTKAKSLTKVKSPAKKTKAKSLTKVKSPAKKTKAAPKKMKNAASKPKSAAAKKSIKQKKPVKKTGGKK